MVVCHIECRVLRFWHVVENRFLSQYVDIFASGSVCLSTETLELFGRAHRLAVYPLFGFINRAFVIKPFFCEVVIVVVFRFQRFNSVWMIINPKASAVPVL